MSLLHGERQSTHPPTRDARAAVRGPERALTFSVLSPPPPPLTSSSSSPSPICHGSGQCVGLAFGLGVSSVIPTLTSTLRAGVEARTQDSEAWGSGHWGPIAKYVTQLGIATV
ncbi:hypothetical protein D9758_011955 [Tetrapyrgos nigripes]|uniref:Uncharacterized protein n=1 Tax=Tetrapyrgos nigripes TaxID=182062 RepID=A0A8H5D268_9AGAR|nr:hypothetical protein D9758_011955 [Tetrapyrgos nigripes]